DGGRQRRNGPVAALAGLGGESLAIQRIGDGNLCFWYSGALRIGDGAAEATTGGKLRKRNCQWEKQSDRGQRSHRVLPLGLRLRSGNCDTPRGVSMSSNTARKLENAHSGADKCLRTAMQAAFARAVTEVPFTRH